MRSSFRVVCPALLLFLFNLGFAEFNRTTSLIDIPTAYILSENVWRFGMNGSVALSVAGSKDTHPGDMDFTLAVGLPRAELALTSLTSRDYSLDVSYQMLGETERAPALALGIQNVALEKYICEVGRGDDVEWDDDAKYPQRCSEQFSFFLVASKKLEPYGTFHVGIGRGRFVGYGPRSRLFNSDMLSDSTHNDAVGIIWGFETEVFRGLGPMFDFDGRDFNIGLKYRRDYYQVAIAAAKLEHRIGTEGDALISLIPRLAIGGSVNSLVISELAPKPTMGSITGVVSDRKTKRPIMAVVSFLETDLPGAVTDSSGRFKVELPPGVYKLECAASGYLWQKKQVRVVAGRTTVCNSSLRRKPKKVPR